MNKVVIVTGGSRGIGAAICRKLAGEGYAVALVYKNSKRQAAAVIDEIKSSGGIAEAFCADVSSSSSVRQMVKTVCAYLGEPYALVNNAGISNQALFTDITDEMWREMIDTDLTGAFYCSREVLPVMIRAKRGRIVNITSMWGETGAALEVHYSAAKAGVIGLTKALAKEAGPSGITVNAVSPGVIMTDMMSAFSKDDVDALINDTPLERTGEPADVAGAVSFLLSENSSFITGQILSVNGGFVI